MLLATVSFSFLKEPDSITYKGFCNTNVLFLIKMKTATCCEYLFKEKGTVYCGHFVQDFLLTLMKAIVLIVEVSYCVNRGWI